MTERYKWRSAWDELLDYRTPEEYGETHSERSGWSPFSASDRVNNQPSKRLFPFTV